MSHRINIDCYIFNCKFMSYFPDAVSSRAVLMNAWMCIIHVQIVMHIWAAIDDKNIIHFNSMNGSLPVLDRFVLSHIHTQTHTHKKHFIWIQYRFCFSTQNFNRNSSIKQNTVFALHSIWQKQNDETVTTTKKHVKLHSPF